MARLLSGGTLCLVDTDRQSRAAQHGRTALTAPGMEECTLGQGAVPSGGRGRAHKKAPPKRGTWRQTQKPFQRLLGKLNTAPSRTPALGQRWVMVLRLV